MSPLRWFKAVKNKARVFFQRKVEENKTEDPEEIRSMWKRVARIEMEARALRREPWRPR
jgi:hypothetical protein